MAIDSFKTINGIEIPINQKAKQMCLESCTKGIKLAEAIKHYQGWDSIYDKKKSLDMLNQILEEKEELLFGDEYLSYTLNLIGSIYHNVDEDEDEENFNTGEESEQQIVKKNVRTAMGYYEKAIELNNPDSMFNLALIYHYGDEWEEGLEKNNRKAMKLYESSIDLKHSYAMNKLATVYQLAELGTTKDIKKAIELFERAVQMNNPTATYNLAELYSKGEKDEHITIEKDLDKAAYYYYKSSRMDVIHRDGVLVNLIQRNKLNWREEYHVYWNASKKINKQILMILLASKFRKQSNDQLVSSVLVKGIAMNIIKFLCHFKQVIGCKFNSVLSFPIEIDDSSDSN